MSELHFSDAERALVEIYAAQAPPVEAIRARMAARAAGAAPRRRPVRRPFALAVAAAAFAVTAAAAGAVVGIRGLHGDRPQPSGAVHPPTPMPSPAAALPTCRLPVESFIGHQGGFVDLPAGLYAADASAVGQGSPYDGWPLAWDAPLHRWVRSNWRMVSPDGRSWLYFTGGTPSSRGQLHIAGADGSDRVLRVPGVTGSRAQGFGVVGWLPEGLLYSLGSRGQALYHWYDPATGVARDAAIPEGDWQWYGGTTLWQQTIGPSRGAAPDNRVEAYDLATHARTAWFSLEDYLGPAPSESPSMTSEGPAHTLADNARSMGLLGADPAGHPLIHLGSRDGGTPVETLYLDAPGHVVVVDRSVRPGGLDPYSVLGDAHGIWIVDFANNVWLYDPVAGLRRAGDLPLGRSDTAEIAGPCS